MAVVYSARDTHTGKTHALKLLLPHASRSEKTRKRFLHEARTMKALIHPHIVAIDDVGDEDGYFYFVMEMAEGGCLAHYLRRYGVRTPTESLVYVYQMLQGLEFAHRAGVVHRDVKPHNMLLTSRPDPEAGRGDGCVVKLTDFGIARVIAMTHGARITGTGDTLGTLAYMSPEQRVDPRNAGPEADIYGVGATLYILATGRRPFDLAMAAVDRSVMERLPSEVGPIVERSTAHSADDRYGSAAEMAGHVADALSRLEPDGRVSARLRALCDDALADAETVVTHDPSTH